MQGDLAAGLRGGTPSEASRYFRGKKRQNKRKTGKIDKHATLTMDGSEVARDIALECR